MRLLVVLAALTACLACNFASRLAFTDDEFAQLTCTSDLECPQEWSCRAAIARCIPNALVDDTDLKVTYEGFTPPPARKAGIKVKDVAELVSKLKNEAKVL